MLREAVKNKTELGLKAKDFMDQGKLVPDDLILNLVKEKLNSKEVKEKGYLLDGFPRTGVQAKFLVDNDCLPSAVIYLNVSDEVIVKRITGRRTDPETNKIYNVHFNPPPKEIEGRVITRDDDKEDKIKTRLEEFKKEVESIKTQFKEIVYEVKEGSIEDVKKQINEVLTGPTPLFKNFVYLFTVAIAFMISFSLYKKK
jgi:adenylate kinase